jgi:hypothetical protein
MHSLSDLENEFRSCARPEHMVFVSFAGIARRPRRSQRFDGVGALPFIRSILLITESGNRSASRRILLSLCYHLRRRCLAAGAAGL